jgi:hypothetical protein
MPVSLLATLAVRVHQLFGRQCFSATRSVACVAQSTSTAQLNRISTRQRDYRSSACEHHTNTTSVPLTTGVDSARDMWSGQHPINLPLTWRQLFTDLASAITCKQGLRV